MNLGFEGRSAVVLAATSGLGLAVARSLLAEGAGVTISGRDPGRLAAAKKELGGGERLRAEALDVCDGERLRAHLEGARDHFGSVDVLVTNAGGPPPGTALDVDDSGLDQAMNLTLRSAVHAIQTVLPWMRERHYGRIVALTSISVRQPIVNLAYSNILRAGLTAYLKTLAGQVGHDGILVNSVCTGLFETARLTELFELRAEAAGHTFDEERRRTTDALPLKRLGDPREFGDFVAFLSSERCSYMTGAAIPYDGGANTALL